MEKLSDKYQDMMKNYPILFKQRTANMSETCMCWVQKLVMVGLSL